MRVETVHRITGPHLLIPSTGAAVWLQLGELDWAEYEPHFAQRLSQALEGLPIQSEFHTHVFEGGLALALKAPPDLLYTACAVLEWVTSDEPAQGELWEAIASERAEEERPLLRDLHSWARNAGLHAFDDEDAMSIGLGRLGQTWPLDTLPSLQELKPESFGQIPLVYLTGTNGKTTTTRMLARIAQKAGLTPGNTSSDGIVVNGNVVETGDWTGPGAARTVLRHKDVDVALLETARGGLMRRGLVVGNADVAVVTNISADHLGEWGLTDVHRLADAKLVVARGLRPGGTLVVNADCPILMSALQRLPKTLLSSINILKFGLDPEDGNDSHLEAVIGAREISFSHTEEFSLDADRIPLTLNGAALHNIYNAAAAGLAAQALGWSQASIEAGLGSLKPNQHDSRGRANLYKVDEKYVLLDFAHNPGGLEMMAEFAKRFKPGNRYFLMGQAGDRSPQLIQELAEAAVSIGIQGVVVKNLPGHAYERDPNDVATSQVQALIAAGQPAETIEHIADEVEAARSLIERAVPGSLTFLIAHENVDGVMAMLREIGAELDS